MYFIITIFLISYLNIKISYLLKNEKESFLEIVNCLKDMKAMLNQI